MQLEFTIYKLKTLLRGFAWLLDKPQEKMNELFIDNCQTCDFAKVNVDGGARTMTFSNNKRWRIDENQLFVAAMVAEDDYYAIYSKILLQVLATGIMSIDSITRHHIEDIAKSSNDYIYFIRVPSSETEFFILDTSHKKENSFIVNIGKEGQTILDTYSITPLCYPWEQKNYYFSTDIKNEKENNETMNMPNVNFDFGPCGDAISMSPYGLAIRSRDGKYLTYNSAAGNTVDVTGLTFDFKGMIYKVPVAIADIKVGDMIMHQQRPMFVTAIDGNNISTIDIIVSEAKNIVPVTNPFGFNFVTKITSIMNLVTTAPDPSNPFGNIMPMMIWNEILNGNDRGEGLFGGLDLGKIMMLSAMTGQQNPFGNMLNFGNLNFNPNNENK